MYSLSDFLHALLFSTKYFKTVFVLVKQYKSTCSLVLYIFLQMVLIVTFFVEF